MTLEEVSEKGQAAHEVVACPLCLSELDKGQGTLDVTFFTFFPSFIKI